MTQPHPQPPRAAVFRDAADIAYRIARQHDERTLDERAQGAWDVENALRAELRRMAEDAQPAAEHAERTQQEAERTAAIRAAALHDAAIVYAEILGAAPDHSTDPRYWQAIRDVIVGLRHLANEAQHQPSTDRHVHIAIHHPDPTTATTAALCIADLIRGEYGDSHRLTVTTDAHEQPAAVQPAAPEAPHHLGGKANAERCPACKAERRNPPYPFLCPAEPDTPAGGEQQDEEERA